MSDSIHDDSGILPLLTEQEHASIKENDDENEDDLKKTEDEIVIEDVNAVSQPSYNLQKTQHEHLEFKNQKNRSQQQQEEEQRIDDYHEQSFFFLRSNNNAGNSNRGVKFSDHLPLESYSKVDRSMLPFKWIVLLFLVCTFAGCVGSFAFAWPNYDLSPKSSSSSSMTFASQCVAFFVPCTLLICFAFPPLRAHYCAWMNHFPFQIWKLGVIPASFCFSFTIAALLTLRFDPLSSCFVFMVGCLAKSTLQEYGRCRDFSKVDFAMWFLLVLATNLRWSIWEDIQYMDKEWWSISMSVILIEAWGCMRPVIDIGYTIFPSSRDLVLFFLISIVLVLLILPIALLTDIIDWSGPFVTIERSLSIGTCTWLRSLFSVAIPQELFFRGIFLNVVVRSTQREFPSLLICSILSSLSFWNYQQELFYQALYYLFGVLTGVIYGWSFLRSRKLLAGIVAHSIVDFFVHFYVPAVRNPPLNNSLFVLHPMP